jgi:hypothetical protein
MCKLIIIRSMAGACLLGLSFTNSADAVTLGDQSGMQAAIQDLVLTDQVHCRPGRWHHRFRPHDGCFRRGLVVRPRGYVAPRLRYDPWYRPGYRRWR